MLETSLTGGFTDAPRDAARAFRNVMNAIARPGTIEDIAGGTPPAPMSVAAGTLALTLLDSTTRVRLFGGLDCQAVHDWLVFHTSAVIVDDNSCDFAFGDWAEMQPITQFAIGTSEYPDRGTTLIVEMPQLANSGATLRGPGIKTTATLNLPEVAPFQLNATAFPLGLDFFFTAGGQIAALPRSTKVESL